MPEHSQVLFGSASEHVRLELPVSLAKAEADFIRAEIVLPRFRAEITPWIEYESLRSFTTALRALYDNLTGSAELPSLEGQLLLSFQAEAAGHIQVCGEAWEHATYGSCLSFELALDQSFLLAPLQTLESLLNR